MQSSLTCNWLVYIRIYTNQYRTKIKELLKLKNKMGWQFACHNIKGYLAIEEKHTNLLTSLRTAYAEELNLKKEQTSYDDLFDSLRRSLKGYNIE
jgi:hypothetical protein